LTVKAVWCTIIASLDGERRTMVLIHFATQPKLSQFHYGGQAVLEGVMIRGQKNMAVAVRDPAGKIVVHIEPLTAGIYTSPIGKWPLVRGLIMLWDTLVLGIRTLMFSADVALAEEEIEFSGPLGERSLFR
jgi:uncharacterized protein YqhQ